MRLSDIIKKLGLEVRAGGEWLDAEISGGYVSDLLSDVLANSRQNDLWVTLQLHPNIVAVASMKRVAAIVIINGREPAAETAAKANEEKIPILVTRLSAFDLVGRLYAMGITGAGIGADGA